MEPSLVRLTVQGGWLGVGALGVRVLLDGRNVDVGGPDSHDVLVQPGRHLLEFSVWWLRRHGHASIEVDVAPAQFVEVYYAPPHHIFAPGAAGLQKQRRKGGVGVAVLMGGIFLAPCLVVGVLLTR